MRKATKGNGHVLSRKEILRLADEASREMLHVSRAKAFRLLDQGKLKGTIAEAELRMFRFLLQS